MYARLLRFNFGPGKRAEAQAIADEMRPSSLPSPGCKSVSAFGDDTDGDYGIFVLGIQPRTPTPRLEQDWEKVRRSLRSFMSAPFGTRR